MYTSLCSTCYQGQGGHEIIANSLSLIQCIRISYNQFNFNQPLKTSSFNTELPYRLTICFHACLWIFIIIHTNTENNAYNTSEFHSKLNFRFRVLSRTLQPVSTSRTDFIGENSLNFFFYFWITINFYF